MKFIIKLLFLFLTIYTQHALTMDKHKPLKISEYDLRNDPKNYKCQYPGCEEFYTINHIRKHILIAHLLNPKAQKEFLAQNPKLTLEQNAAIRQYMPKFDYVCSCHDSFPSYQALRNHQAIKKHFLPQDLSTQQAQDTHKKETPKASKKRKQDTSLKTLKVTPYNPTPMLISDLSASPTTPMTVYSPETIECQGCKAWYFKNYLHYLKQHIYISHLMPKICPDCTIQFSEIEDFAKHMEKYHKTTLQISQDLALPEQKELNQAIARYLPKHSFELACSICDDVNLTQEKLEKHCFQMHHSQAPTQQVDTEMADAKQSYNGGKL